MKTLKIGRFTSDALKRKQFVVLDETCSIRELSTNMNEALAFARGHSESAKLRVFHVSQLDFEIVD